MNGGLIFREKISIHLPILRVVVARPLRQEGPAAALGDAVCRAGLLRRTARTTSIVRCSTAMRWRTTSGARCTSCSATRRASGRRAASLLMVGRSARPGACSRSRSRCPTSCYYPRRPSGRCLLCAPTRTGRGRRSSATRASTPSSTAASVARRTICAGSARPFCECRV